MISRRKRRSGLHFYVQDTFAEVPQERQNSERILEVKEPYGEQVRTLAQVYERLQEDGFKIELVRVPLADSGRAPPLDTWDALVAALKDLDAGTAVVFNCQMGRGRTTLGTIIASLVRRALDGGEEEKVRLIGWSESGCTRLTWPCLINGAGGGACSRGGGGP